MYGLLKTRKLSEPSLQCDCKISQSLPASDLASGQHLSGNKECMKYYEDKQFSILTKGRTHFHLSAPEACSSKFSNLNSAAKKNSSTH